MESTYSIIVWVLATIVVVAIAITLLVAIFSYAGYKIRQRRRPQATEEIPDFFWRLGPEMFVPPPAAVPGAGGGAAGGAGGGGGGERTSRAAGE